MFPLSVLDHAIGLTPSFSELMNYNHAWEHQDYPLVGLRYLGTLMVGLTTLVVLLIPVVVGGRHRAADQKQAAAQARAA